MWVRVGSPESELRIRSVTIDTVFGSKKLMDFGNSPQPQAQARSNPDQKYACVGNILFGISAWSESPLLEKGC